MGSSQFWQLSRGIFSVVNVESDHFVSNDTTYPGGAFISFRFRFHLVGNVLRTRISGQYLLWNSEQWPDRGLRSAS